MTDDDKALVEGLRKTQCPNNMGCNPLVRSCQCAIMDEAADRIEAQAAENERLRNALSWAEKVDPDLVFAIRVHAACGEAK